MLRMREADIVRSICRKIISRGGFAYRNHGGPFSLAGVPDITAVYLGRPIFLEVKRDPSCQPTKIQKQRLDELRKAGAIAECVTHLEQVEEILQRIDSSAPLLLAGTLS